MALGQKEKKTGNPFTDPESANKGLDRKVRPSDGLLKEIDGALKDSAQKKTQAAKRRAVLDRCGC